MSVFVHGFSSTPVGLLDALADYSLQASIKDVELIHMTLETDGKDPFPDELYDGMTYIVTFPCFTLITFHAHAVTDSLHIITHSTHRFPASSHLHHLTRSFHSYRNHQKQLVFHWSESPAGGESGDD